MRKLTWGAVLVVAAVVTAPNAWAQRTEIDPGMTREQVVARLGRPVSEHSSSHATYLYYSNGDEKRYGMHDFVVLEDGKVVDAVFRSEGRKYNGKSSSPAPVAAEDAIAKGHGGRAPSHPAPPVERKPAPPVERKPAPPVERKAAPAQEKKAGPPAARTHEPLKTADTKKIAPASKAPDTTKKKGPPAPTKKP
ncbi:MAG TPA: outer membrane protein assembly factor BamE [Gemmatimonadaceae bacterium]|jgi:hypothetical protein